MLTTRQKIALAHAVQKPILLMRRLMGLGHEAPVRRMGINWCLDLREGIDFSIFLLGVFERSTLSAYRKIVTPGMTVLDIGANSGSHTLHLARLIGDSGRVIAFEPTQWAVEKLRKNIECNPTLSERIIVKHTMLTDTDNDEVPETIHSSWPLSPDGDVHPLLRARSMSTNGAAARTLDSMLAELAISSIGFIKIDVDGYECQVLGGMLETLKAFRPPILMEFSPYGLEEKGGSLACLVSQMSSVGYRFFRLGQNTPMPMDVVSLSKYSSDGMGFNIIARSPQH